MAAQPDFSHIAPKFGRLRQDFTRVTEVDNQSMEEMMSVPRSMGSAIDLDGLPTEVCNNCLLHCHIPESFLLTLPRIRPREARLKMTRVRPRSLNLRVSSPSVDWR
jgi:hypothetical protein